MARASHNESISSVFRMKRAAQLAHFLEASTFAVDEVMRPALSNATIQTEAKPAAFGITCRAAQELFLVGPPCSTLMRRPVQAAMTSGPRGASLMNVLLCGFPSDRRSRRPRQAAAHRSSSAGMSCSCPQGESDSTFNAPRNSATHKRGTYSR